MTPEFKKWCRTYPQRFMADLGLSRLQVAGMGGNLAVESDQFRALQEYKPTVKGSKGGWGWPQWTGYGKSGRRGMFEKFADEQGYKRDDPEGFYAFMVWELQNTEKAALAALKRTRTLDTATEVFMKRYERPGVQHLDRRKALALEALREIDAAAPALSPVLPSPAETAPEAVYTPAPIASAVPGVPWWAKALGLAPSAPVDARPGLKPNGDPALYDVQAALKKLGYEPVLTDGLNGERTRNAVRAARRRNGLPDGDTVDAAFRAALPGMLPAGVSETRTDADDKEMQQRSPDLFAPLKGLFGAGSLTTGIAAVGAASDAGILDKVKDTLDNVSGAASSAQQGIGVLFGIGQWLYSHWWIILGVLGIYVALKGYIGWLKLKALWRQGRAS